MQKEKKNKFLQPGTAENQKQTKKQNKTKNENLYEKACRTFLVHMLCVA